MEAAAGAPEPSRRARKKERTRHEIYDAAMALFERQGFDAVTVEAICEAADVARATFFLHFPTKAALLYELSDRVARDFAGAPCAPDASAARELRALVDAMIGRLVDHAGVMSAMVREFFANPEAIQAAHARGREFPDRIEAIVRRGQARGEFRRGVDARLASAVVLSTAGAILSGNVFAAGELPVEAIRDQFFQVIFGGLLDTSQTASEE
ncbi:MAG TPA: TetR/AcrR family transcriptional regulator [Myxococcota bacterium]|nr:TetR/AcrR family transcriptional regulator [Myxococcota bacterium]